MQMHWAKFKSKTDFNPNIFSVYKRSHSHNEGFPLGRAKSQSHEMAEKPSIDEGKSVLHARTILEISFKHPLNNWEN